MRPSVMFGVEKIGPAAWNRQIVSPVAAEQQLMKPSTLANRHRSELQIGLENIGVASLLVHKTLPEVTSSAEQVPSKEATSRRS